MKKLTSFGVKDPVALMEALHKTGQQAIINIVEASSAPESRKQLRTWGINAAADMIGVSPNTIRSLEEKKQIHPPTKDQNNRKQYNLELINQLRNLTGKRFKKNHATDPIVCCTINFKGGVGKSMTSLLLIAYSVYSARPFR